MKRQALTPFATGLRSGCAPQYEGPLAAAQRVVSESGSRALAAALLAAAALVSTTGSANGAAIAGPAVANSRDSEPVALSATSIDGTVLTRLGVTSSPSLARLYVRPTNEQVSVQRLGQQLTWRLVAIVPVDAGGHFSVALPRARAVAGFIDKQGLSNFTLMLNAKGSFADYTFSHRYELGSASALAPQATASSHPVITMVKGPNVASESNASGSQTPEDPPSSCTSTSVGTNKFTAVVGSILMNTSGDDAYVTYVNGTSTTLGAAVSSTGAPGSFSASGTDTVSHTSTTGWAHDTKQQSYDYTTVMTYTESHVVCKDLRTGAVIASEYDSDGSKQYGGSGTTDIGLTKFNNCASYGPGGYLEKDTGRAYVFSGGVSAGGVLGVNLSATTGWNSDATEYIEVNHSFHICGQFDGPAASDSGGIEATS